VAKANEQDDLSVLKPIHRWIWAMQILSKEQKGERKPGKRLSTLLPSMEISTKNLTRLVRLAPYLFEIEMLTKDSAVLDASPCRFIKEEFEEMRLLAEDYIDFS